MSKLRSRKIDYVVIYCKPGGVSNGFAQTSSRNLLAKKLQKLIKLDQSHLIVT